MIGSLVLALALGAAPAADISEPALIRIDAVASDARGRVVDNLRPEDFEVLEDGVARPVESVRFVRTGGPASDTDPAADILSRADERAAAVQDGVRVFAIFLDEYHVTPGAAADRVREALLRFVNEAAGPRDLLLVIKPLDSLLNLRLTRDRRAVSSTIESFQGRKGVYEPRNAFEQELIAGTPQRIEAVRIQIATSALNALATHLASLGAARTAIIFASEGFARGPRRRSDEALPSLDTAVRTARRASVPIFSYDPGDAGADAAGRETLQSIADETEGRVIVAVDPAGSLGRIASDASAYYTIEFRSGRVDADGRFHPVEIRVRKPNIRVTARKGYWAPSADDVLRAKLLAKAKEPAPPPEPAKRISPLIRPWFGIARGASGSTQISFVWEPAGRVPGDRSRRPAPARISITASKPDGTSVFQGVVRSAAAASGIDSADDPTRAVFDAPPGRLRLQMRIEDALTNVVDTDIRDLIVRPLNAPVALGSAEVVRARSARDFRSLAADAGAVPTPAREFSRTERLLIRVPAYAPDTPAVTAGLVSKGGGVMRTLPVSEGPSPNTYQIDLPLAGLASGSYLVQLTVKSAAGQARDEVAFRVTP
jgi:VWFA-related protein